MDVKAKNNQLKVLKVGVRGDLEDAPTQDCCVS